MRFTAILICLIFVGCTNSQELARFTVNSGSSDRIDCPIAVPFSAVGADLKSQEWQLVEISENTSASKAFQIDQINKEQFWFILDGFTPKDTERKFALIKKSPQEKTNSN